MHNGCMGCQCGSYIVPLYDVSETQSCLEPFSVLAFPSLDSPTRMQVCFPRRLLSGPKSWRLASLQTPNKLTMRNSLSTIVRLMSCDIQVIPH
jgi:hypothetical protein